MRPQPKRRQVPAWAGDSRDCIALPGAIRCAITRHPAKTRELRLERARISTISVRSSGYAGDIQNSDHGRVLRVAAGVENSVRWPFGSPGLSAGRGGSDQCRRLPRAHAGQGPQGPDRNRFAQTAGQGDGRRRRRRQSQGLRPRRPRHAGAAIPFARRARTARSGGDVQGALHVDHEHAAAALREAHPRSRLRRAQARLYRSERVGQFRSRIADAVQPRPAGDQAAGRKGQCAAGHAADQLQGRQVRQRQIHRRFCAIWKRTSTRSASTRRKARSNCR